MSKEKVKRLVFVVEVAYVIEPNMDININEVLEKAQEYGDAEIVEVRIEP